MFVDDCASNEPIGFGLEAPCLLKLSYGHVRKYLLWKDVMLCKTVDPCDVLLFVLIPVRQMDQ